MNRLRSILFHRRAPLVVALIAAAYLWPPYLRAAFGGGVREVTVEEAAALVGRPGTAVLDANVREIFLDGHLPGARHVSPLDLAEADLPAARDAALLFYCKNGSCRASHDAARRAAKLGWTNVAVMTAGIDGWAEAGRPVERGEGGPAR